MKNNTIKKLETVRRQIERLRSQSRRIAHDIILSLEAEYGRPVTVAVKEPVAVKAVPARKLRRKRTTITPEMRAQVSRLRLKEMSRTEIAKFVGISVQSVFKILKAAKKKGA